ncbi:UDP-glucose 4-epimerase [Novosphingobium hassiacum]|uniref:UDP-glucose 4-epimerase n=1 Tax=Novosphingobium hassiacum TaxID=173676 RepID=A0A7W6A0N0_9SPHN|nr:NAD(P)-dependent oxidoreductase [Novosphingobium hassiacum]MBB3862573.1 UDP-glucose 4-epimerase [Novosphingobium hassiacum]
MGYSLAITGASGALGRLVVKAAVGGGHRVVAIGRTAPDIPDTRVRWLSLDLRAPQSTWRKALVGCDVLIHLAAVKCEPDPDAAEAAELWTINVQATRMLVGAMRDTGVGHMLLASAANAFAARDSDSAVELAHNPGRALYLGSKVAQELVAAADCAAYGIDFAAMRISSVIGTGASVIDTFARRLMRGEAIMLEAGGGFSADFVSGNDVAQGLLLAVRDHLRGTYNLSSGRCTTLLAAAEELRGLTGAQRSQIFIEGELSSIGTGFPAVECERLRKLGYRPTDFTRTLGEIVAAQKATRSPFASVGSR